MAAHQAAETGTDVVSRGMEVADSPAELQSVVDALTRDQGTDLIVVAAGHPLRVLASSDNTLLTMQVRELEPAIREGLLRVLANRQRDYQYERQTATYELITTLTGNSAKGPDFAGPAAMIYRCDARHIQAAIGRHAWKLFGLQFIPFAAAAILIALILRHYVVTPLDQIEQTVLRYTARDTDAVVPRLRDDEVGAVGQTVNEMMRTVSRTRARTQAIVDRAGVGIALVDRDGRLVLVNPAFSSLFGTDEQDALGKVFTDFINPEDTAECWGNFRDLIEEQRAGFRMELRCHKADGSPIWVAVNASRMPEADQGQFALAMLEDITERKRGDQALREALALQQAILDGVDCCVISASPDGLIRIFNKRAEAMFGYRAEELIGQSTPLILHSRVEIEARARELTRELGRPVEAGIQAFVEHPHQWVGVRKDGSRFPVLISIRPFSNAEGQVLGYCGAGVDMTERCKAEDDLRRAKEAAEAGSRAKSEFLANMSHEIRTPMNGILGMTELALDTKLSPEQKECLDTIKDSSEALLTVINDILDFSKVEAGKLDLEPIPFDLRDLLERTIQALAFRAEQRGLELACDISPAVPNCVIGDPDRLRQIVVNLVGNALKFTEQGEVTLRVEACEDPGADGKTCMLRFAVHDTGIGIPLEKQAIIFNAFTQADGSTTRRFGGTGLGLTISARLIELMKGRIWVESEVGRGSTFHFTAEFGVTEAIGEDSLSARVDELNQLRVLVVDDNATNRRVLRGILTNWHMTPALAASGREALALMREAADRLERFPIVLLDHMMPEMDGFAVAEEIQKNPKLAGAMIIMLSSGRSGDARDRCQKLGFAGYLHKPIRQSDLLRAMLSALAAGALPSAAGGSSVPSTVSESARGQSDSKRNGGLKILLVEDNRINQRVALRMLEKEGHHVTIAEDGKKALIAVDQDTLT